MAGFKKIESWKYGRILEVAKALHYKYDISDITFEIDDTHVSFLSKEYYICVFYYHTSIFLNK